MKKENIYAIIILLILIVIYIGSYSFRKNKSGYYENYNRVISEPDSIKIIDDVF